MEKLRVVPDVDMKVVEYGLKAIIEGCGMKVPEEVFNLMAISIADTLREEGQRV